LTAVVVTGAARGIGRAVAIAFAEKAADVVLLDACHGERGTEEDMPTRADLDSAAEECRIHGAKKAVPVIADVCDSKSVSRAAEVWRNELPDLNVVVNSAGVLCAPKPAHLLSDAEWATVIETDLGGPWRIMRAAVPSMIERGGGTIINVSSTAGLVAFPSFAAYVAAKHGLVGLTRALALDYAPHKIRVNAVCPTSVAPRTGSPSMLGGLAEMLGISLTEYIGLAIPNHPTGELPADEDVAAAVMWLASDDARHVTGVALPVDGGFTAR
jgi:NAD(P)-dependent dehydrogenase (short-subunit alcohol dehydrogenase family)